jgi:hypothetical protein
VSVAFLASFSATDCLRGRAQPTASSVCLTVCQRGLPVGGGAHRLEDGNRLPGYHTALVEAGHIGHLRGKNMQEQGPGWGQGYGCRHEGKHMATLGGRRHCVVVVMIMLTRADMPEPWTCMGPWRQVTALLGD